MRLTRAYVLVFYRYFIANAIEEDDETVAIQPQKLSEDHNILGFMMKWS